MAFVKDAMSDSASMFHFPRQVLLIEIERYCQVADCRARNVISLTKQEAIEYRGFDCQKCEQWNSDAVNRGELPESWAAELDLKPDDSVMH